MSEETEGAIIPLSTKERAPQVAPASELSFAECKRCSRKFYGVGKQMRLANHVKHKHPDQWKGPAGKGGRRAAGAVETKPRPELPARTVAENLTDLGKGDGSPTPVPRRKPAAESIASGVSSVASVLQWIDPPTGNALKFSAAAIGEAADDALAGTWIDRKALQGGNVVVKKAQHFKGAALPVLIFLMTHDATMPRDAEGNVLGPGRMFYALEDTAKEALSDALICAVPSMKAKAAKQAKAMEALEELKAIDPEIRQSADPLGTLLERILFERPMPPAAEASEDAVPTP